MVGEVDGDGVADERDRCPGTAAGVKVDANGCPEAKLFEEGKKNKVMRCAIVLRSALSP